MTLSAFTVLRRGLRCCGALMAICLGMTGCAPQTNSAPQPERFVSAAPANPAPEPSRWVAVPQQPPDPTLMARIPPNQNWVLASESALSIVFINIKEKIIIGNTIRVWEIRNILINSGEDYRSSRILAEYNCEQKKLRYIQHVSYSDFSADGRTLFVGAENWGAPWQSVAPDTTGAAQLRFACSLARGKR